ncbi:MAG: hypothetical protein K2M83_02605 [Muribaculaceae bacterium]|nr:hypothetical protein [Muribaculaceae bacterium]
MAKIKNTKTIRFKEAVESCPEIKDNLQKGLSAMGANSKAIKATDTKLIDGSVDIDNAVKALYPNDARWDYVIGFANEALFVEVHPADTKNVTEMVEKVKWLKKWLSASAPMLKELHKSGDFFWIPSGRVKISKGSIQFKQIAANNIQIKKQLNL